MVVFEVEGELCDDFLVEELDGLVGLGVWVHVIGFECYKENYLCLFFLFCLNLIIYKFSQLQPSYISIILIQYLSKETYLNL